MATEMLKQALPKAADEFLESMLQIWEKDGLFLTCFALIFITAAFLFRKAKKHNCHH